MTSLARWCFVRRRLVVALWVVALIVIGATSGIAGSKYSEDFQLPNTESKKALDLLTAGAPAQSGESATIVVNAKQGTLDTPEVRSKVANMFAEVATLPHVSGAGNFYAQTSGAASARISPDRTIGFVDVQLDKPGQELPKADIENLIAKAQSIESDSIQVELGGNVIQFVTRGGGGDGGSFTEILGLAAAAVVLFLAFGSVFTMFLPIITALLAIGVGVSVIGYLSHAYSIPSFGPVLAVLIGLGVGVDYALFIVSRHRVNLQQGHNPEDSVVTAINTSGRAVLFAGTTVCIGILGLLLLGVTFLYGLALSVVVVVLLTMLASITFLPAMLGFVGMKALSKKQRNALAEGAASGHEDLSPGWFAWARIIQRHSIALGTLALVAMLVLAVPVLSLRLGSTDAGGDPKGTTTRAAYYLLAKGFGPGFNGPLQLVAHVNGPDDVAKFRLLTESVKTQKDVASVTPVVELPGTTVAIAQVYPSSSPQDKATTDLVDDLRSKVIHPFNKTNQISVYVGGTTAIFQDFSTVLANRLPLFIGVVVALSFILLMAVFRSLMIPVVASLMNLLSAGAAFGVVVAVFQWGWGAGLIGIDRTGPILAFLPVMAFAILFGLSMDYEVFLVSRMFEEWHRVKENDEAIALGQAETGRVISAAAAIMVVLFASFVFGGEPTIKLFGVALATAVFLDAMLVRTIIVPAAMHVLGNSNWYLPKFLDKILPKVNVEAQD